MSTSTRYDDVIEFAPRSLPTPAQPGFFATLRTVAGGLRAGLAAERHYYELMARGVPHAEAVAQIFDEHYVGR